jgi:hypothetical protein
VLRRDVDGIVVGDICFDLLFQTSLAQLMRQRDVSYGNKQNNPDNGPY